MTTATTTTKTSISTITTTIHSSSINHKNINNSSVPLSENNLYKNKTQIGNLSFSTQSSSVQQHPTNSFNATVKTLVHKTLTKFGKAHFSDFTSQYSELPPFIATHGGGAGGGGSGSILDSLGSGESSLIGPTGSELSATLAADMVTAAATTLPAVATRHLAETTTAFPVQTVATFIAGNKNRATTIIVYPTVSPESIVIPIVSCIFGFPILALIVICCLRRRAKLARERDRRRNYDMQDHAVSLVRFSPIHRLSNYRSSRAISLRPERSLSQGFTSLELDTVTEERCSDIEQTQTEILNAESPMETTSYKMSFSS